jgi:hypothetical protein
MTDKKVPVLPEKCRCGNKAIALAVPYSEIPDEPRRGSGEPRLVAASDIDISMGRWRPMCGPCMDDVMCYTVDYDRMKSIEQALDWTLHLSQKTWYPRTNWPSVMYGVCGVGGSA